MSNELNNKIVLISQNFDGYCSDLIQTLDNIARAMGRLVSMASAIVKPAEEIQKQIQQVRDLKSEAENRGDEGKRIACMNELLELNQQYDKIAAAIRDQVTDLGNQFEGFKAWIPDLGTIAEAVEKLKLKTHRFGFLIKTQLERTEQLRQKKFIQS